MGSLSQVSAGSQEQLFLDTFFRDRLFLDMHGVFLKSLTVPDFVTFPLKHEQINTCQVEIYVKEDFFV